MIGKRYKKIGRMEEGNEILRYLRRCLFPAPEPEEETEKTTEGKFSRINPSPSGFSGFPGSSHNGSSQKGNSPLKKGLGFNRINDASNFSIGFAHN
jgi:hypothetical protein